MAKNVLRRGFFAAVTIVSLGFGTVQAFAAPRPVAADADKAGYCLWHECRAQCGPGCGGECIGTECYCDC